MNFTFSAAASRDWGAAPDLLDLVARCKLTVWHYLPEQQAQHGDGWSYDIDHIYGTWWWLTRGATAGDKLRYALLGRTVATVLRREDGLHALRDAVNRACLVALGDHL